MRMPDQLLSRRRWEAVLVQLHRESSKLTSLIDSLLFFYPSLTIDLLNGFEEITGSDKLELMAPIVGVLNNIITVRIKMFQKY